PTGDRADLGRGTGAGVLLGSGRVVLCPAGCLLLRPTGRVVLRPARDLVLRRSRRGVLLCAGGDVLRRPRGDVLGAGGGDHLLPLRPVGAAGGDNDVLLRSVTQSGERRGPAAPAGALPAPLSCPLHTVLPTIVALLVVGRRCTAGWDP